MPGLFLTIATTDYLPRVGALHASLAEIYGKDVPFAALCIGDEAIDAPLAELSFDAVRVADLKLPTFWDMAFRYEKGALANALKPFFIRRMMAERAPDWIVFLDADTLVYSRLAEVHALLDTQAASIVLTPHFDRPQHRARKPFEIDLLRHGVMNGGFVALRPGPSAGAFLDWWADHLRTDCRYEPEQGYYGDQHWLDLAPALFEGVHVLRHRGYNAAYWNYPDRAPRRTDAGWLVGDDPLRFFHFSQWRIEQGEGVEGCMERLFGSASGGLADLLQGYLDHCSGAARTIDPELSKAAYPFDRFIGGAWVPRIVREAYARANPPRTLSREGLFGAGLGAFNEPSAEIPAYGGVEITRLYVHIWRSRPDLRRFELATREGQLGFLRWVLAHAAADHNLPDEAIEPARRSLAPVAAVEDVATAERAHAASAARKALAEAYAEHRRGDVGLDALMAQARACAGLLARTAELDVDPSELIQAPADLFQAARTLRDELRRLLGPHFDEVFLQIEGHGAYLAGKLGRDYEAFLNGLPAPQDDAPGVPPPSQDDAGQEPPSARNDGPQDLPGERPYVLDVVDIDTRDPAGMQGEVVHEPAVSQHDASKADAVLNTSSNLIDIVERWTRRDEFAPRSPSPTLFVTAYDERADPASLFAPWEMEQLRELACIEPRLGFQLDRDGPSFRVGGVRATDNPLYRCLAENEAVLEPPPLAVLVLGAAKAGISEVDESGAYLRAAQEALGIENVLAMRLDGEHPAPGAAFADGTRIFCAARLAPYLTGEQRFHFARDYLSAVQPRIILNLGSELMWRLYATHGRPFSALARLYACLSGSGSTDGTAAVGPAMRDMPDALPHLTALLTDNEAFKAEMGATFAFPQAWLDRVELVRRPVDIPDLGPETPLPRFRRAEGRRPAILWAERISHRARSGLLIEIARLMPGCDFEVYGTLEDQELGSDIFGQTPNIRYRGSLSSFFELPHEGIDMFLHTSMRDGLPRTLLGAAALRLPIVAGAVGGVPELVSNERGWLVRGHSNPAAYGDAITSALSDTPLRVQRVRAMLSHLMQAHSTPAFTRRIEELRLFDIA